MFARDGQGETVFAAVRAVQRKGGVCIAVIGNIRAVVIAGAGGTVSNNPAGKAGRDFFAAFDIAINNQGAVFREEPGETAKGAAYVINILKIVEVVFFYI